MQLYRRMKRWKALPGAGGILDQEEEVMRNLDLIADLVETHDRKLRKIEQQRLEVAQTMAALGGQGRRPALRSGR